MRKAVMVVWFAAVAPAVVSAVEIEQVAVVNLPEVQTVDGRVQVEGPVAQTRLVTLAEAIVPPVEPRDTNALVGLGTIDVSGFAEVVLSVAGEVKADFFTPGAVGAILIPDEPLALDAFTEAGQLLFPIRVEASAHPTQVGPYFSSEPETSLLAFPHYRAYLFNTTDQPAVATLFAYLRN